MAAPTQAYPPWLSPAPVTATVDGTVVIQTTVIQFPQTYYGPSIPLGPGWVFGGSTFPASIATSSAGFSTESTTASTPTSAAPSNSASSTPSSPLSTTTSASFTPPSTSSSGAATSSGTASASSPANTSHGVSSGTRLAIILSTILGTILLAVLLLVLCRIRRQRQRRSGLTGEGTFSAWSVLSRPGGQPPVEAAVAAEEGEGAAFLTGEHGMREHERERGPSILPAWPKPPPPEGLNMGDSAALAAEHTVSSGTGSDSKTDSSTLDSAAKREDLARFNASRSTVDAGSLFFNPGRGNGERRSDEAAAEEAALAAGVAAALATTSKDHSMRPPGAGPPRLPPRSPGRPMARSATPTSVPSPTALYFNPASPPTPRDEEHLYRDDVHRFGALRARESLEENAEERFLPPPRLNPDRVFRSQNSSGSRGSWVYPDSPPSETDERATLLTARRVNVGPVSQPVLASSPSEKSKSLEGWVTPPDEGEPPAKPALSPSAWAASVGMGGLTGFARGLGRLSWFRRMDNEAGPSGTRHSSPSRSRRGPRSRPTSGVSFAPGAASRPHSGLLHPGFGSRPHSGVSFRGADAELGMRAPGIRVSAAGSANGSGGSGSGKSGGTVYHSASSRPRTPFYASVPDHDHLEHPMPPVITFPPELDLGQAGDTIRSVDALDLPVPERALPFSAPVLPDPSSSRSHRTDTASSRGTGLAFPPGLVAVPKWDRGSHSGSSNREEERDVLEDEPPQAGGEWSSLRSKGSGNDLGEEVSEDIGGGRRGGPVTRSSTGEQAVHVVMGEPTASETASFSSEPRQPGDIGPTSPRSPTGLFVLTPRVSLYASSHSDIFSHSGSGSHSSRPSQHTTVHSQDPSQHSSSNHESEEGPPMPHPGAHFHRASLSAMGGGQGPPQLPPMRPLSHMQPMMERPNEDRETEDESAATTSRPGSATSRPTVSETTHTGTFTSGTMSTSARTTVPSTTGSPGKH